MPTIFPLPLPPFPPTRMQIPPTNSPKLILLAKLPLTRERPPPPMLIPIWQIKKSQHDTAVRQSALGS